MAVAAAFEQNRVIEELEFLYKLPWCQPEIESVENNRAPEQEIYGRSLGTIYKLGIFMVDTAGVEIADSPEAQQARAEFYTSVEEGFGTDMELGGGLEVRDFDRRPVLGGRVMAKDCKTAISGMTEAGLVCAQEKVRIETAQGDYRFVPQLVRSEWDHQNALWCDAMARGETDYNTRIVISPFPEEGAVASGDAYWRDIGYVPHLRRGFVQLYHAGEDGFVTGSLSFDGSSKERLREIFGRFNIDIPENEVTDNWLQYAVTETLSEDEAKTLALEIADLAADPKYKKTTNTVGVTRSYRAVMDTVFDESYTHACESLARGYQTPGVRQLVLELADKAASFNERYAGALYKLRANEYEFTDDDMVVMHELLVYSTIEMMRALHLADQGDDGMRREVLFLQNLNSASFQNALSAFGAEGARNNRTYSACGLSISLGDLNSTDGSPQSAFGGKGESDLTTGDSDKYGSLTFDCPKCHKTNRRPRNKLIPRCQKCGTDVRCG